MKAEITTFLKQIEGELLKQYTSRNLRASGKFERELRKEATETEGTIYASGHARQMINGRRPGSLPPVQAIEDWIQAKGLDLNPWAVAKSIAKKGTTIFRGRQGLDVSEAVGKYSDAFMIVLSREKAEVIQARIAESFKKAQEALA